MGLERMGGTRVFERWHRSIAAEDQRPPARASVAPRAGGQRRSGGGRRAAGASVAESIRTAMILAVLRAINRVRRKRMPSGRDCHTGDRNVQTPGLVGGRKASVRARGGWARRTAAEDQGPPARASVAPRPRGSRCRRRRTRPGRLQLGDVLDRVVGLAKRVTSFKAWIAGTSRRSALGALGSALGALGSALRGLALGAARGHGRHRGLDVRTLMNCKLRLRRRSRRGCSRTTLMAKALRSVCRSPLSASHRPHPGSGGQGSRWHMSCCCHARSAATGARRT